MTTKAEAWNFAVGVASACVTERANSAPSLDGPVELRSILGDGPVCSTWEEFGALIVPIAVARHAVATRVGGERS